MKTVFMTSVAAMAIVAGAPSAYAQDQAETAEAGEEVGEIVITARRVTETLADVPTAITVFTADTLDKADINNAEDFIQLTPGVTIVTNSAEAGDTQINIRGINGARDAESSVALVVDGILKTNTAQLNQDQGTLRQVEILKGPQGALYGRNAAAGAIVIQTVKPTDALSGEFEASYGENETMSATGFIAGPLSDAVGFVLSGNYRNTDGFYRNVFLDSKTVDDQEVWGIDGRIVADLGDTTIDAKARYADLNGASINFNAAFHLPNFGGAFYEDVNDHPFNFYSNIRPTNTQETFEASIKVDHDFDAVRLTAWALYSNVEQALTADGTSADFARYTFPGATPASVAASNACFASTAALTGFRLNPPGFIGTSPVPFIFDVANGSTFGPFGPTTCDGTQFQVRNQEDWSAEVRIASNGDGPLAWQLGAYYLNINREVGVSLGADLGKGVIKRLFNDADSDNPTSQLYHDRFKTDVYAAFGSLDYEVSDALKLGLALRYDIEDRGVRNLVPTVLDPITGGPINPGQAFGPIQPQSETFKQLQPKLNLNWQVADNANIYANWGIGFKSGGFNNQGSAAIVEQAFNQFIGTDVGIDDQFRKEKSSSFEAGIKGKAGAISYDIAGYYTDVTDMQFFEFFVGSFGLLRVVSNIDDVKIWGGEANVSARITDGWSVFGSVNVTDSEIQKNSSRPNTVGNKSPHTADYTINLGSQIDTPINDSLDLVLRADYRITGPTWFHTLQNQDNPTLFSGLLPLPKPGGLVLPAFVGDARYDVNQREAFGVLDLRIGIEGENWKLTAFANNMLDRKYLNDVIPAVEFGGSFISPGARRLVGVEAGFKF